MSLSSGHHIRSVERGRQEKSAFDTVTYVPEEGWAPEPPESLFRDRLKDTESSGAGLRLRWRKPGFEQNQKNGVSEVSANRGPWLTKWVPARNPFAEANISDFEIL